MNKPPSRRKKVIPAASGEAKPASATIEVVAVEVLELTKEEQNLR